MGGGLGFGEPDDGSDAAALGGREGEPPFGSFDVSMGLTEEGTKRGSIPPGHTVSAQPSGMFEAAVLDARLTDMDQLVLMVHLLGPDLGAGSVVLAARQGALGKRDAMRSFQVTPTVILALVGAFDLHLRLAEWAEPREPSGNRWAGEKVFTHLSIGEGWGSHALLTLSVKHLQCLGGKLGRRKGGPRPWPPLPPNVWAGTRQQSSN